MKKIISILLVAFCVLGILSIGKFTNNFTGEFKTFYAKYDGELITTELNGVRFYKGQAYKVDVGYTLGFMDEEVRGYSVRVEAEKKNGKPYEFTVAGEKCSYVGIGDLTKHFTIEKSEKSFLITPNKSFKEALSDSFSRVEIILPGLEGRDMFSLVVYSEDGKSSVRINFDVLITVERIELNTDKVVF